jgi:hypothetical protein
MLDRLGPAALPFRGNGSPASRGRGPYSPERCARRDPKSCGAPREPEPSGGWLKSGWVSRSRDRGEHAVPQILAQVVTE